MLFIFIYVRLRYAASRVSELMSLNAGAAQRASRWMGQKIRMLPCHCLKQGQTGMQKKKNETTFFGCKFAVSPSETVSETVPYAADLGPPTVVRTILL